MLLPRVARDPTCIFQTEASSLKTRNYRPTARQWRFDIGLRGSRNAGYNDAVAIPVPATCTLKTYLTQGKPQMNQITEEDVPLPKGMEWTA